jgi:hypothetical protein
MAISKEKKKKKKPEICPNHPKIFAMQFITFLPQNVSIFLEIFPKVHLTMMLLLETYFVGEMEKICHPEQSLSCASVFFSFHFIS